VTQQVRTQLSEEVELSEETESLGKTEVTLRARDGHCVSDVPRQMRQLPNSATHLFLSVGGNDGLHYLDAIEGFDGEVQSFSGAVRRLREIQDDFREDYRPVLQEVLRAKLPTALCTVYNGNFEERGISRLGRHDSAGDQRRDRRDGHQGGTSTDRSGPGSVRAGPRLREPDRATGPRRKKDCRSSRGGVRGARVLVATGRDLHLKSCFPWWQVRRPGRIACLSPLAIGCRRSDVSRSGGFFESGGSSQAGRDTGCLRHGADHGGLQAVSHFRPSDIHPDQKGSWSLKSALPVFAPDLAYDDLDIQHGMAAVVKYSEMIASSSEEEKATLRNQLLKYCERDTYAMVEIHRDLQQMVE